MRRAWKPHTCVRARRVADRLERDVGLDGPAALEPPGRHAPHRVPVGVELPLVGALPVGARRRAALVSNWMALRRSRKVSKREPTESPCRMLLLSRRISLTTMRSGWLSHALERHVDVVVVVEQPDLGLLGGRLSGARLHLDEVRDRANIFVDRLVEAAVDSHRGGHAHGTDGRPPLFVVDHGLGQRRRRRTVAGIRGWGGLHGLRRGRRLRRLRTGIAGHHGDRRQARDDGGTRHAPPAGHGIHHRPNSLAGRSLCGAEKLSRTVACLSPDAPGRCPWSRAWPGAR